MLGLRTRLLLLLRLLLGLRLWLRLLLRLLLRLRLLALLLGSHLTLERSSELGLLHVWHTLSVHWHRLTGVVTRLHLLMLICLSLSLSLLLLLLLLLLKRELLSHDGLGLCLKMLR